MLELAFAVYVAGFLMAIAVWRDPWPVRLGTAAVWPVGLVSFAAVTVILVAAALYLWPMLLLALVLIAAVLWLSF